MIIDKKGNKFCESQVLASLSVMIGLFVGQVIFGIFGDFVGRSRSFFGSTFVMALGSILSIFTGRVPLFSSSLSPVLEFSTFRFIVGFGAGGLYPIVATITRESSQEDIANSVIALVFGPIGSIGLIFAPLLVLFMSLTVSFDVF